MLNKHDGYDGHKWTKGGLNFQSNIEPRPQRKFAWAMQKILCKYNG
jgi:hypothetical protein